MFELNWELILLMVGFALNSKFFLLVFITMAFGCGVKSQPLKRPDIAIDSYVQSYTGTTEPEKKKEEKPSSSILEYKK